MIGKRKWAVLALGLMAAGAFFVLLRRESPFSVGPALSAGKVAPQISATWDSAVLLAPDGTLWSWGGREFGLQGSLPTRTLTETPRRIGFDSDWTKVSASWNHTLALKADGSLWGWGWNPSGALTATPTNHIGLPRRIGSDRDWADISTGAGHVMALKNDGTLWLWGQNDRGQVGDGATNNVFIPFQVETTFKWSAISAGSFNSYAIAGDGTIWGWGLCGIGVGRGADDLTPTKLDSGSNWVSISSGDYHVAALRRDGTLWIRGQNAGTVASAYATGGSSNFVQIGVETNWNAVWSGQRSFLARKTDGTWWLGGRDRSVAAFSRADGSSETRGLSRIRDDFDPWAVGLGYGTTIVLTKDGVLWAWGQRLGVPGKLSPVEWLFGLIGKMFGSSARYSPTPPVDRQPRRIWRLPPAAEGSVPPATNATPGPAAR